MHAPPTHSYPAAVIRMLKQHYHMQEGSAADGGAVKDFYAIWGSIFLGIQPGFDVSHAAFEDMLYRLNLPKKKCCITFPSGKPRTSCEPHTPLIDEPRPTH